MREFPLIAKKLLNFAEEIAFASWLCLGLFCVGVSWLLEAMWKS
jgi:hypothetical protein